MPNFGIAIGHDAAPEDVADFVPYQPSTPGLQYGRRTPTAGGVKDEAPYIRFTFSILDESQYTAVLTQAGLLTVTAQDVTIHAQDENYVWTYFNGTVIKPLNEGRKGYFLYNVPLLVIGIYGVAS